MFRDTKCVWCKYPPVFPWIFRPYRTHTPLPALFLCAPLPVCGVTFMLSTAMHTTHCFCASVHPSRCLCAGSLLCCALPCTPHIVFAHPCITVAACPCPVCTSACVWGHFFVVVHYHAYHTLLLHVRASQSLFLF